MMCGVERRREHACMHVCGWQEVRFYGVEGLPFVLPGVIAPPASYLKGPCAGRARRARDYLM